MDDIVRGDVWLAELDPVRGHEQGGIRPVLVLSDDAFNASAADLVFVAPLTTRDKGIRSHVRIEPPSGGVRRTSFIMGEHLRSVSTERLRERWGTVDSAVTGRVEESIRRFLRL